MRLRLILNKKDYTFLTGNKLFPLSHTKEKLFDLPYVTIEHVGGGHFEVIGEDQKLLDFLRENNIKTYLKKEEEKREKKEDILKLKGFCRIISVKANNL